MATNTPRGTSAPADPPTPAASDAPHGGANTPPKRGKRPDKLLTGPERSEWLKAQPWYIPNDSPRRRKRL